MTRIRLGLGREMTRDSAAANNDLCFLNVRVPIGDCGLDSRVSDLPTVFAPFAAQEDDKVQHLVKQYGPKRWTLISKHLKGRTGKQCRERYPHAVRRSAGP